MQGRGFSPSRTSLASKTFSPEFWGATVDRIASLGFTPVIVGADRKDTGTVQFQVHKSAIDLRNQTTLTETIWLMKNCRVLLTNDSAPLHMAASGDAFVGFIATIKHPDYTTHWRHGKFGWRMKNFSKGGVWDIIDHNPGADNSNIKGVEWVEPSLLESWLLIRWLSLIGLANKRRNGRLMLESFREVFAPRLLGSRRL